MACDKDNERRSGWPPFNRRICVWKSKYPCRWMFEFGRSIWVYCRARRQLDPDYSAFQHDRMNVAAIIRLLAMHRATVAEEALIGIGIDADVVDDGYPGVFQPHPDEAGE